MENAESNDWVKAVYKGYKCYAKRKPINTYQFELPKDVISCGYFERLTDGNWEDLPLLPNTLENSDIKCLN